MAKKRTRKKGPLKRYQGFNERKQDRILRYAGADEDQFETFGKKRQRRIVRRGIRENRRRGVPMGGPGTMNERQARRQVGQEAQYEFGPAQRALDVREKQIPSFFDNYRQQVTQQMSNFGNYAQPLQQQAVAQQQQAGQVAPGTDPSTPAGQDAQEAAQARSALTGLGLTTLNSIIAANQGYFAGQAGPVAAAGQLGEQSRLAQDRYSTARERGEFKRARLGEVRGEERAYGDTLHRQGLERAAFNVDAYEAETGRRKVRADVRQKRRERRQERQEERRKRRREGGAVNKYGIAESEWRKMGTQERQAVIREFDKSGGSSRGGLSPSERRQRRKERRGRREKRGGAVQRIDDARTLWEDYKGGRVEDPRTGRPRNPTPGEIKERLRGEGYSPAEIHIMLMVRAGKPLTPKDRATAKRLGIWPIPKSWRGKKPYQGGAGHGGAPGPAGQGPRPT